MNVWLAFGCGIFLGTCLGICGMCLLAISGKEIEDDAEDMH